MRTGLPTVAEAPETPGAMLVGHGEGRGWVASPILGRAVGRCDGMARLCGRTLAFRYAVSRRHVAALRVLHYRARIGGLEVMRAFTGVAISQCHKPLRRPAFWLDIRVTSAVCWLSRRLSGPFAAWRRYARHRHDILLNEIALWGVVRGALMAEYNAAALREIRRLKAAP